MRYKESKIYNFTTPKMCDQKFNQKFNQKFDQKLNQENSFRVKI